MRGVCTALGDHNLPAAGCRACCHGVGGAGPHVPTMSLPRPRPHHSRSRREKLLVEEKVKILMTVGTKMRHDILTTEVCIRSLYYTAQGTHTNVRNEKVSGDSNRPAGSVGDASMRLAPRGSRYGNVPCASWRCQAPGTHPQTSSVWG